MTPRTKKSNHIIRELFFFRISREKLQCEASAQRKKKSHNLPQVVYTYTPGRAQIVPSSQVARAHLTSIKRLGPSAFWHTTLFLYKPDRSENNLFSTFANLCKSASRFRGEKRIARRLRSVFQRWVTRAPKGSTERVTLLQVVVVWEELSRDLGPN